MALQLAYSLRLKHVLFLDVMIIAAGFVLRALAGLVAMDVGISEWLLLCTGLLALFIGLGEAARGGGRAGRRGAIPSGRCSTSYSVALLDELIAVVTPSWSWSTASTRRSARRRNVMLVTLPFVLYGIFRVLFLIHHQGRHRGARADRLEGSSAARLRRAVGPRRGRSSAWWPTERLPRALVTGGSGFLGAHLADALAAAGFEVRTLDVVDPPAGAAHDFVRGDVRDAGTVRAAVARLRGGGRQRGPRADQPCLGRGLPRGERRRLPRTCSTRRRAEGAYVLHVSSTSIYGVPERLPVTRETPLRPFEDYGRSKAEAERLVESRRSEGFPVASMRTRALLGPGRLGVFDLIFARVRAGRRVPVLGADKQVQMCHVDDFCSAALAAIERRSNGTYNICAERYRGEPARRPRGVHRPGREPRAGRGHSALGGAARAAAAGRPAPGAADPWHWRGAPAAFVADLSDAERELGWRPARSNVDALLDAYEHFLRSASDTAAGAAHRRPLGGPLARILRR